MRAAGLLPELSDVAAADHICWVHGDQAAFDAAVRNFAVAGLDRGDRLLCVGDCVIDSLRSGSLPFADCDRLLAAGSLVTSTVAEVYGSAGRFDPQRQLEFYDAATRSAISDGHHGLRVLADVSPLAADPSRRADLLRWEHLADDYVAHGPGMSAMCVYRPDLDAATLTDAASVHPLVHSTADGLPSFRVFFEQGRLVVVGSVDAFGSDRLARILAFSPVPAPTATLDLSRVEFIDVAGCRTIATWVQDLRERSVPLSVMGASPLVRRMWQVLGLAELAPVTFVEAAA